MLGNGEFVERIIKEAEAKIKNQLPVKKHHQKIDKFIAQICNSENVSMAELIAGSRLKEVSSVRARIAAGLVKRQGFISRSCQAGWGIHLGHIKNPKQEDSINKSIRTSRLFYAQQPVGGLVEHRHFVAVSEWPPKWKYRTIRSRKKDLGKLR